MKLLFLISALFLFAGMNHAFGQESPTVTQVKVQQLIEKKAEFHRLTGGVQNGYRIKIHFGTDREQARNVNAKFVAKFPDFDTYEDYQQPYFVILVGDYKTKLEAYQSWKTIHPEFPTAFIVKDKIYAK